MDSSRPEATTHFAFLQAEWPEVYDAAQRAERVVYPDARASSFYARRALELAAAWMYRNDRTLTLPYQDQLSALIHEPTFRDVVGPAIFSKARILKDLGNQAVHSTKPIRQFDAMTAVRELFHFAFWLARTYARDAKAADGLAFDPNQLPKSSPAAAQTQAQLQAMAAELEEKDKRLTDLLSGKAALDEELKQLREEVAKAKAANTAHPDTHDYSEAETRDYFIDLLLREAGWALDKPQDRELEVSGMPNNQGKGFVDYVLWGDAGKPLAVVEAKRTKRDPRAGQQQAKLYADCLEQQFDQRPIIFYSNGYDHWLWDDASYPPRGVQGFLKKDELELLIQRRSTRQSLASATIDPAIVERYYQTRAIRRIGEAFEKDHSRKSLVVMASAAGIVRAKQEANGLGLFIRSLVGMDREAAKQAFGEFLTGRTPSANQIEFVNLIVEHLTEHGVMDPTRLYESPFTDINPRGPEGVFTSGDIDTLVSVLTKIRGHAAA